MTVDEAFDRIRKLGVDTESIYTCYVTDSKRKLKGVVTAKITEPALRGVVAVLTSNTTDVPPLKQNEDGSVEKDETAEDEKTIVEIQGVVTGTYYTGLESGYAGLGPNQLRIKTADGEEDYELSEALVARVNLEDIIGKRVIAYFDKNEYKLTGISESNNKVIKIKEADIARPLTSSAVKYYNEKGKLQTVSIAGYTFIYNGKYVPLKETIRSFKEIIEGKHDQIPESYFLYAGTIDEVVEKWKGDSK